MKTSIIVFFLFVLSSNFSAHADVLIVSDIDDTVKQTNSEGRAGKVYGFLRNKPFPYTRDLFNELVKNYESQGEKVTVVYVSAAYKFMFDAQNFIQKSKLPAGKTILRKLNSGDTFTFKYLTIGNLIKEQAPDTKVFLFGDNSEHDHDVYWQLVRDHGARVQAFVRDVATWAQKWNVELEVKSMNGVNFFFSERELLQQDAFAFASEELRQNVSDAFKKEELVPGYTTTTLKRRIGKKRACLQKPALNQVIQCKRQAKKDAAQLMRQYYAL